MFYVGDFSPGQTVYIYFNTFSSDDPSASVTITNFLNTDVHIHKDDDLTQRNNAAGITIDVDVDGITGSHFIKIDTANNTVADFFTSGHDYFCRIEGTTVDGATINAVVGHFSLDNRMVAGKMVSTDIASLASQTSFTLDVGSADNDAYNGCTAIISDIASGVQKCYGIISDYVGNTKTVTLAADPGIFTIAAGDNITIIAASALCNVKTVNGILQTANDNGADINAILIDTAEIGAAGAGLTNINLPNQTMDITGNLSGSVGSVTAQVSADVTAVSGDATAANNLELACDNYSVTRGLSGTALPAVAADGAGGLPISDAGGLDMDIALQKGLFADGTVWVDPAGTNSTAWPYGSAPYPTSTIANGKIIADAMKIQRINITGTISLVAAMENYELIGSGNIDVAELVDINSQSIEHSTLKNLTVTGIGGNAALISDQTRYTNCLIYAHTNIQGVIQGGSCGGACSIRDTGYATFTDVYFGQGGACTLTLQAPTQCDIINMRGDLVLSGMDGGVCKVTMTDGSSITIDNTCTAGSITLTGIGTVTDNSTGTTVVALADTPTVLHATTDAAIAALNNFDPANDAVANVTLVDTTTTNTDMLTVANIIAGIADGSYDLQEMMRIIFAVVAGKTNGGGTTTLNFRDSADGKNRVQATVDANNNRTAMTLDGS
jgi:hypothetical protein